jgi:N-acetylglucosamine-6-phosphate deacetylase
MSPGRYALINGRVILPQTVSTHQALIIEGDKIVGLEAVNTVAEQLPKIDVAGRYITPGLIDIHTHGALGRTFNEPSREAFGPITDINAKHGVTALLATTATAPIDDLVACLEFSRQWMYASGKAATDLTTGAQILGVHLEGPYFCPAQAGAQDPANIRTPDDGTPEQLLTFGAS